MATFKDKATNICSLAIAIATTVGGFAITMHLPPVVLASCGLVAGIATAVIGFFSGKGPDGKPLNPSS
ncbi:MAG: hypothetical protein ACOYM0_01370 [Bacteroidales bacterium]